MAPGMTDTVVSRAERTSTSTKSLVAPGLSRPASNATSSGVSIVGTTRLAVAAGVSASAACARAAWAPRTSTAPSQA
jgi:hypothetical protein